MSQIALPLSRTGRGAARIVASDAAGIGQALGQRLSIYVMPARDPRAQQFLLSARQFDAALGILARPGVVAEQPNQRFQPPQGFFRRGAFQGHRFQIRLRHRNQHFALTGAPRLLIQTPLQAVNLDLLLDARNLGRARVLGMLL